MSTDPLALSDEEFAKLPVPTGESDQPTTTETETTVVETESEVVKEESDTTEVVETEAETENKGDLDGLQNEETNAETSQEVKEESTEVDYKALYEQVTKPFKANGKEMSVDNVDDIRQLMQMGANYNKKMAALKPNLKLVKMLENNGLLDEAKLSFLIDLDKRNPDAVRKLIKESGIDPLDVDINAEVSYKPNTYNVNDKELELDAVIADIRETDTFNTTLDIVGNKWDESSKRVLVDNPSLIRVINTHVGNGVYETITNEVERLRTLGKLEGMSDIDAYKAVGDFLYAPKEANAPTGNYINTTTSKATNKEDPRLNEKRKAASTTKSVVSNVKPNFNPLSMSDEEFEKIASSKFI